MGTAKIVGRTRKIKIAVTSPPKHIFPKLSFDSWFILLTYLYVNPQSGISINVLDDNLVSGVSPAASQKTAGLIEKETNEHRTSNIECRMNEFCLLKKN
jgi:hypothetical protein